MNEESEESVDATNTRRGRKREGGWVGIFVVAVLPNYKAAKESRGDCETEVGEKRYTNSSRRLPSTR
jgi:hypothetical protein